MKWKEKHLLALVCTLGQVSLEGYKTVETGIRCMYEGMVGGGGGWQREGCVV